MKVRKKPKTQYVIWVSHCSQRGSMFFFLTQKIRPLLSGVIIQLRINTNVAALLSNRTASLPPSLYVAGKTQCCLCCQDSTETLVEFFFLAGGWDTCRPVYCFFFLSPSGCVSQRRELCAVRSTVVLGWPAEKAEMDRGGGTGVTVCLFFWVFLVGFLFLFFGRRGGGGVLLLKNVNNCWQVEWGFFFPLAGLLLLGISRQK